MDLRTRLESHSIPTLRKEISKTNIKGYSKMKKAEVVDLMLKHSDRFNHIKHSKSEEFKKEKIKEIMSKNEKTEVKSKGDFEKLKVKGIEYFYNKKNQKLYDVNTKKLVGKIEKGQVVLKKKEEPKKEEPKKEEPKIEQIKEDTRNLIDDLVEYGFQKQNQTIFSCTSYFLDYVFLKILENNKNDCALDFRYEEDFFDPFQPITPTTSPFYDNFKFKLKHLDKSAKKIAEKYLECKKNKKVLVIPLRVKGEGHMNSLIFNPFLNQLEWYEPHGEGYTGKSGKALKKDEMDKALQKFLNKMNSFMPQKDKLQFSSAVNSCPRLPESIMRQFNLYDKKKGLQSLEHLFNPSDIKETKGATKRKGFCCMWSILQMDLRLRNPKIPENELGTKLTEIAQGNPSSFFNKFIHGYTNSLISELVKAVGEKNLTDFRTSYSSKTEKVINKALKKVYDSVFKKINN